VHGAWRKELGIVVIVLQSLESFNKKLVEIHSDGENKLIEMKFIVEK